MSRKRSSAYTASADQCDEGAQLLRDLIQYRKHKNKRCDRRHASLLNRVDAVSLNPSLWS